MKCKNRLCVYEYCGECLNNKVEEIKKSCNKIKFIELSYLDLIKYKAKSLYNILIEIKNNK